MHPTRTVRTRPVERGEVGAPLSLLSPVVDVLGLTVAFELKIVPTGVEVIVSVRDPRDRSGKIHRAPFVIPSAALRANEKPPPRSL